MKKFTLPERFVWASPMPEKRWKGFRRHFPGAEAFQTLESFETALLSELDFSLAEHELSTLGRLLKRGKKIELEVFIRTHGANPLFEPQDEIDVQIGVAKADVVDLNSEASAEANQAVLNGDVVHVLFQAGEASRFQQGPFYTLEPVEIARALLASPVNLEDPTQDISDDLKSALVSSLEAIKKAAGSVDPKVAAFLLGTPFGPKQPFLIRAALRRIIRAEIKAGRLAATKATEAYVQALGRQKILFFVSRRGDVAASHDQALREKFKFYGFSPENLVTIEQELARGVTADEEGRLTWMSEDWGRDAAGHLYALIQAARAGDFTTYTESGRPIKPREVDALAYLASRGARFLSVIRINDMDRHSTEIVNPKALSYALSMFQNGYVNVIETVANPEKQKGGTGLTLDDPEIHVLTETHENSFPSLSRAFEVGLQRYIQENEGRHPAYNAMRQWTDLQATRRALQAFGGRIVYVPRQKMVGGEEVSYLGVDMPMGDLSLLFKNYPSRMFQFAGPQGRELLIHDMKTKENIPIALRTVLAQLQDSDVLAVGREAVSGTSEPFSAGNFLLYSAPSPEFL